MKNVTIIRKYTEEIEFSEIDFEMYDKVLGKNWDEKNEIESGIENKNWYGEAYAMDIDKMIEVLNGLKKGGANYVEVMYHCDHIGYVFNGVEIRKATKEEIAADNELIAAKNAANKQREIDALEKKLNQLKG